MSTVEEQVNKIFNERDYKAFKWVFLRYICEQQKPVTDYELFLASGLSGYMGDEKLMKDYVLDDVENVYKVFMDRVMKCLVDRNFLQVTREKENAKETTTYVSTSLLEDKCEGLSKYLMGDVDKL